MTLVIGQGTEFDRALLGHPCWLESQAGERIPLPVQRWRRPPGEGDEFLLSRCTGPTLDIGCGPGRLTIALAQRGVAALGIDTSATAIRLTRRHGAIALHRNVFDRLPGEGRWRHVLLADGNIGIGGDPITLLRRTAQLIGDRGTALLELDAPGRGLRSEHVRLREHRDDPGPRDSWFAWAWLGLDALEAVAGAAALRVRRTAECGGRWFAELGRH
jgi:SAM-dependent methyltransferase